MAQWKKVITSGSTAILSGVGIGTTAPTKALQVKGDISSSGDIYPGDDLKFEGSTAEAKAIVWNNSTDHHVMIGGGNNQLAFYSASSAQVAFNLSTGGSPKVGIGNTTPVKTLTVEGDISASGVFYGGTQPQFLISSSQNTDIDTGGTPVGTEDIASVSTGSYDGAFFDYVAISGSKNNNMRAGTVTAVWNSINIEYTEVSTIDIGNTGNLKLKVELAGSAAVLRGDVSSDNWNVKTLVRTI